MGLYRLTIKRALWPLTKVNATLTEEQAEAITLLIQFPDKYRIVRRPDPVLGFQPPIEPTRPNPTVPSI